MNGNRLLVGVTLAVTLLLAAVAVGAARGGRGAPRAAAERSGPNVLVIVTDDARVGTMVAMPRTRRWMADGGVTYRQGYDTTPSCCPSRSSIFSGRYVHNHGVLTQAMGDRLDQDSTMQHDLKAAGYATAMAGKLLNRWPLQRRPPWFDHAAVANGGYYDQTWAVDGHVQKVHTYSTTSIGDKALEYLAGFERDDARPWLLYLATFAPHDPRVPEPRYAHATFPAWQGLAVNERDVSDKPGYLRRRAPVPARTIAAVRDGQLRTLKSVDDLVDRVMRRLQATGELDDTLVLFLSDNGYAWGEHRWVGKFLPYTESLQVPFYARWPGHLPAGTSSDRMVANIDIRPTVLAAAGVPPTGPPMDGRSLLAADYGHDMLLFEYWHDLSNAPGVPTWAALRTRGYEYVEDELPGGPGHRSREYYDLRKDPGMERNLLAGGVAGGPPVAPLAARLAAARECVGTSCP